jgi:hypothetical protein
MGGWLRPTVEWGRDPSSTVADRLRAIGPNEGALGLAG